ncbi:UDP-N-acetylglucosamine 2-epimerase (hydrolyzing) [Caldicellulosiruptor changbaiensis]|uniref:UDP-N-acetylglucosamine 2-epimerase (Hydrolyzing) n=1 Tax=Caldicellulosiruptor changbaiensis TaxID=1222016 RepID=A0A3T0D6E8_9FIRM|nr:UDP-N-acetylglucosamine 2-epimerase [Caldicellulosiruptor changbaiensis]AZT90576.1 UDP-N-acetylglucosamine 2-epimerase (hydrolyzing) [Caldicellulosiruptor changbaiensis]
MKKRKVLVVTGSRAEYGLLYWTMKEIQNDDFLELQIVVTGSHLVDEFGFTVEQIRNDGFRIDEEIDMLINSSKKSAVAKSMGIELIQLANAFERLKPDILLILGDRYEIFIAATCAMMMNIPIAHINGGEASEGAIDEQIRHAITKMAHIHFVGAEYYKQRILMLGEEPWRIYNVGQPGIENIRRTKLFSREEICRVLGLDEKKKIFLVTYHPVTLEEEDLEKQIDNLLNALNEFDENIVFTYPNADYGYKKIIEKIHNNNKHNFYIFKNLGSQLYLSVLKNADIVIGNSSSGIIEAPYFRVPVVNIGNRQKGRFRHMNIIDVNYEKDNIIEGILKGLSLEFKEMIKEMPFYFGDGNTSIKIKNVLKTIEIDEKLIQKRLCNNKEFL